ncbi:Low-density lipoprotein receptor-related protein 2 [Takifugu flavidus]|uniref:Low-density lipoprotein receptor-related protein 2 n=1 Tax=Takifugu flavidus TaxID=433684 RepID=A0A5C6NH30_9TELE|nr:Low-density lipoprotein receptor-related protein 2 [Takifugu flavidus]
MDLRQQVLYWVFLATLRPNPGFSECPRGQFSCVGTIGCVNTSARCDGQMQCPTGSDEDDCPRSDGCLNSDWSCTNGLCIPKELRCDGVEDCLDHSDEMGCGVCGEDSWRCPQGMCLTAGDLCNGEVQCSDGSDEPVTCGKTCSLKNGGCSHECVDKDWGALCLCPGGFKLSSNGAVCEDVNECAPPSAPCAHHCINTVGSYHCRCKEGFRLEENAVCVAAGAAVRLLTLQRNSAVLLNVKSGQVELIQTLESDPVALAFDVARGWYYWADDRGSIYRSSGQHAIALYAGEPGISGLACDWLNGNLFWANLKTKSIYMQAADGKSFTVVLKENISPSGLVLIPVESLMFWMDAYRLDRVTLERSWMDGSERRSLAVLTAQAAHSLSADVAARRLYWISDIKESIETVRTDGTARQSFTGLFRRRLAFSLAVFESFFYWVDREGLWQVSQKHPDQKRFLSKAELPVLAVYHPLQQPPGPSACSPAPCQLCLLTKRSSTGFTCSCANYKMLFLNDKCEYPSFIYATRDSVIKLEFREGGSSETHLFATHDGILSFDLAWNADWLYWANLTGHIQRASLTQVKTEVVPTPVPVCLIRVDQKKGNIYWVSFKRDIIGSTTVNGQYSQQLYSTTEEIQDLHLDWLRGTILWLEHNRLIVMSVTGGRATELLHLSGEVIGNVAFDLKANSLLWNSKFAGFMTLSLQQERSRHAGRRWNISGSVMAAMEPFILSYSGDVITLWDRRDESVLQTTVERGQVSGVLATLKGVHAVPQTPACAEPSVLCRRSSVCVSHAHLCDGIQDCRHGDDEESCTTTCLSKADFLCKDHRSCVPKSLVCDGRSHCSDGSDEMSCPSVALHTDQTRGPKCRRGSRMCRDGTQCVLFSHVCDGERDCRDGSDEEGCDEPKPPTVEASSKESPLPVTPPCTSPSVLCPGSSLCISPAQFCDGRTDCPDGSDEGNCPSVLLSTAPKEALQCQRSAKLCDDGKECVLFSHVCDGETDCLDGSDELRCPETCKPGEFQCSYGKTCIPQAQVCDGRPQCRDQSDEVNCIRPPRSCEFRCADGSRCIPKKFVCDEERDCPDGTDEVGCVPVRAGTTASTCTSPSFLCPNTSKCISQQQLCDGHRDCPDGVDELNCVVVCRNQDDFLCADGTMCILRMKVCDGHVHCPDGSDEKLCRSELSSAFGFSPTVTRLRCRSGFKPCNDGLECVMYTHVCDGEYDCRDGSDEKGCASHCEAAQFQCAHGNRCIPQGQVCDGKSDCQDRSDELDCQTLPDGCHQHCDNKTRCIPKNFLCDGERDCADGSDEEKCGLVVCGSHQYRCASGQCVSEGLRCDGYPDCSDHSDEVDCARPPRCPAQLRCPNSHECLQKEWLCDGEDDCKDGSDEKNCEVPPAKCRKYQWQCGDSSQCIPLFWRCDGREDCRNGVDEYKCSRRRCASHLYQCGSGECLNPWLVCNGFTNCVDNSDEGPGCDEDSCSSPSAPRCEQHCISTPEGPVGTQLNWSCGTSLNLFVAVSHLVIFLPSIFFIPFGVMGREHNGRRQGRAFTAGPYRCSCAAGFRLHSSALSCVDIDECNEMSHTVCKHICLNTPGSYVCHCHPDFYLEPDNKSCKTKDEPLLLASVQSELWLLGVHSGSLNLLSSVSRPVFSLDYHWAQQRVYWLSPDYQSIRWADIKNPNSRGTLIKGVKSDSIAVDWIGQNLYWADGLVGQILVVKLSDLTVRSQSYTVALGEDLEQPSSLVLLPHLGLMLWSETGSTPQIERSGMDGSKREVVVSKDLSWPVSLAYDFLDNRVYWADEKLRCIGSTSLDGDDIKILQLAETPNPFSVAVFNDRVFWSDTKRRTIRSADKNTGKDQKVLLKRPGQPFGLKVMHELSQQVRSNPCDQRRCSHLCLLAPAPPPGSGASGGHGATAVCRCPKGMMLSPDRITCSMPKESSFILLLTRSVLYQIYLQTMLQESVAQKKMPTNKQLVIPGVTGASGLDLIFQNLLIYVADPQQGVNLLKLGGSRSREGLTPAGQILKLMDDSVAALAVDWVTSNLYWSSIKKPDLHVTSRADGHTAALLHASTMVGITSIAVHPPSGWLCFTAVMAGGRNQAEVVCSWMDGRNKGVLWTKSSLPGSLSFSSEGTVIYWADTVEGVISSIGLDGSRYKQHKTGPGRLLSFTHTENLLVWATRHQDVTKLWFSDGLQPNQLWFEMKTSLVEVRAYSTSSQSGTNKCSTSNGGCAQLCLAYPGGRRCACGRGSMTINTTSCSHLPRCPSGEESCFDGSKCIPSSRLCDGRVDCPDHSDELDCPNTSSATPEVSTPAHVNSQRNSVLLDSPSCGVQRCHGHGTCVTVGSSVSCLCTDGYGGESCQLGGHPRSHTSVVLVLLVLVVLLLAAALLYSKRRGWNSTRSSSTDKETLMANMHLPHEHSDAETEELESPVDVKIPAAAAAQLH